MHISSLPRYKASDCFSALSDGHLDAYYYVDINGLVWDNQLRCWTKDGLTADLSSSLLSDSTSFGTLPTLASTTSLGEPVRPHPSTPEYGHRFSRPPSALSFRSEDLQTIPSQEVCLCLLSNYDLQYV